MKLIYITEDCVIYNDMPRGWIKGKGQPAWHYSLYHRWWDMWNRCNSPESKNYKTYKDCEIDERYRKFSNYINDVMKLENFDKLCENPKEWHIDKDKIDPNNRHYTYEHLIIMYYKDNMIEPFYRTGIHLNSKPIIGISCLTNQVLLFKNISDVDKFGFKRREVSKCCRKIRPHYMKFRWYYLNYRHEKKLRRER